MSREIPFQLTYGITPPKISASEEKRRQIAEAQSSRISSLDVDAVVVYDLQDESSRTDVKRPFPYMQAIDPLEYAYDYLSVPQQKIVYRSTGGQTEDSLREWLLRLREKGGATVLVGAPSKQQRVSLKLSDAYRVHRESAPDVLLGGVLIAERHGSAGAEDERVRRKVERGCQFFVSQAVYSVGASKGVLSDLYYGAKRDHIESGRESSPPPVLVTLSPCGSVKTLEFMRWLGVQVPRWLENELLHAADILEKSVELSLQGFEELVDFAREKGLPLGCNVESVSLSKAEIDASVELAQRAGQILGRKTKASGR